MARVDPAVLAAARAIWDRGRTKPPTFDDLTENQKTDVIADAGAALATLCGLSKADLAVALQAAMPYKNGVKPSEVLCATSATPSRPALRASATSLPVARKSRQNAAPGATGKRASARMPAATDTGTAPSAADTAYTKWRSGGARPREATSEEPGTRQPSLAI